MSSLKYIGLDVHLVTISIAVLNASGKLIMEVTIENQATLVLLSIAAEQLASKVQSKFERHIETRQIGSAKPNRRNIVNSVRALLNNSHDFSEASFARVVNF